MSARRTQPIQRGSTMESHAENEIKDFETTKTAGLAKPTSSSSNDAWTNIFQKGKQNNSSLHGSSYHLRLALVMLLRAFNQHLADRTLTFKIKLEDATAGKFDDIVLQYASSSPGQYTYQSPGAVYVQAKHKLTSGSSNAFPSATSCTAMITKESLLTNWNTKTPFSIAKYFTSFLVHNRHASDETATYMLCTNARLDHNLQPYLTLREYASSHILTFCNDIGAKCYQFRGGTSFPELTEKLRSSSVECLPKEMASLIFNDKHISFKVPLFNLHAILIAKCLEKKSKEPKGVSKFKDNIFTLKDSSTIDVFRNAFECEYRKLLKPKHKEDFYKHILAKQISIDDEFFRCNLNQDTSTDYAKVDEVISEFYDKFVLVCNSVNDDGLYRKSLDLMPAWVDNEETALRDLHFMVFNAMKSERPTPISLESVKNRFMEIDPNKTTLRLQSSTKEYVATLRQQYPAVVIQPNRLEDSELYEFVSDSSSGVYHYRSTMDVKISSLVIHQTVALLECECLFIDNLSFRRTDDTHTTYNVVNEVLQYISDVNHSTINIITIIGKLERSVLKDIGKMAKKYRKKVITVAKISNACLDERFDDHRSVRDLTCDARKRLFEQHGKVKLLGTSTPLRKVVEDRDSLSFLFSVLHSCTETEQDPENDVNKQNYGAIKAWYIPRSYLPLSEYEETSEIEDKFQIYCRYREQEIPFDRFSFISDSSLPFVKSIIVSNVDTFVPPGFADGNDHRQVYIFLNDAGCGKSTYFSWLTWYLSTFSPERYVFRLNALQYSTDFSRLRETELGTLHDTQILRILYRLTHLALFVSNVTGRSIAETDGDRQVADRCATRLVFAEDGTVVLDEEQQSEEDLTTDQLLELRLFKEKFNERQLVLLLDGFDEISPHYKSVVLKCFARFTQLRGIRQLYLSSRPYDLKTEFEQTFPRSSMYQLKPFSQRDQMLYLYRRMLLELDGFRQCKEDHRIVVLGVLSKVIWQALDELQGIPLLLKISFTSILPLIEKYVNFNKKTIELQLLLQTKFERLQLLKEYMEMNLKILVIEKLGCTDTVAHITMHKTQYSAMFKLFEKQHSLLAVSVIIGDQLLSPSERQEASDCMQEIAQSREKTGIITGVLEGMPQFAHRIFAEYFAALYLYKKRDQLRAEGFFRSRTYWTHEMKRVRDFFDRLIIRESAGCDIHMAVLCQWEYQVTKLLKKSTSVAFVRDGAGRMPLHLAVQYRSHRLVKLLLARMSLDAIGLRDDLFQRTALDYAFVAKRNLSIEKILERGARLEPDTLMQRICANDLRELLIDAENHGSWLRSNRNSKPIANQLQRQVVHHCLREKQLDMFAGLDALDSLTILEFCAKRNLVGMLHQFVLQISNRTHFIDELAQPLLKIALAYKAHSITAYLIDAFNIPVVEATNVGDLVAASTFAIEQKRVQAFRRIFAQLCHACDISYAQATNDEDIASTNRLYHTPAINQRHFPKVCCVRNSKNDQLSLHEHTEQHARHDDLVIEALLATAVHEGNVPVVSYIVSKTNTTVTNKLIATIMRLLPKDKTVCHHKSMAAFHYLLERTTDLNSTDEEGRNLLHMTAQTGCFFMMHCLIVRRFDPSLTNVKNGWNVFNYVAFNGDEDRSDKTLEYLVSLEAVNWFEQVDSLLNSNFNTLIGIASSIENTFTLNKQQHALLAIYSTFDKDSRAKLLSDQQQQEGIECIQQLAQCRAKTPLIKAVERDVPKFRHRIFAEYFAACWLYENKHRMRSESVFHSCSYWKSVVFRTRDFFDRMITAESENCEVHMAVLKRSQRTVAKLLAANLSAALVKDSLGRSALHLAAECKRCHKSAKQLLSNMTLDAVNAKDYLFGWSALDYAFISESKQEIKLLLDHGARVNLDNLLEQIFSNNLRESLVNAMNYGKWLNTNKKTKRIEDELYRRVVQYVLAEGKLNLYEQHSKLDSLTAIEFCIMRNAVGMVQQFVLQTDCLAQHISTQPDPFIKVAFQHRSHDIITYLVEQFNVPLRAVTDVISLTSAANYAIMQNKMKTFRAIFQQLCLQCDVPHAEDTDLFDDIADVQNLPNAQALDRYIHPKVCCVSDARNVRLALPEYDKRDGNDARYLVEALLAKAVHEGNIPVMAYIVQKTNTSVTNRLIVMVMRLLPKDKTVCHHKSMAAFNYLLERTTDLNSTDEEGRNLLHMTAQNGCFFMLHCLINKGFDVSKCNTRNGWNAFQYVAFNEDEDRSDKTLEYLMRLEGMNWFEQVDGLLNSNFNPLVDTPLPREDEENASNLNRQQHTLLAICAIFKKESRSKLLSECEQQQAIECIQNIAHGHVKTALIKGVQNNAPRFTHHIFAEYFAACWLYENKDRMQNESVFRSRSYWTKHLYRMRNIFDRLIVRDSKGCDIHMAVLNHSEEQISKLLLENPSVAYRKDAVDRLPLHLVAVSGLSVGIDLLTNNVAYDSIDEKDRLFQWSPIEFAFVGGCVVSLKNLLARGAFVNVDTLLQQISSNNLRGLLSVATNYEKWLKNSENSNSIANQLRSRIVGHLQSIHNRHRDPVGFPTVSELYRKHDYAGILKQLNKQRVND